MYCKNLLKRQKQKKTVFYCKKDKRYIDVFFHCQNCSNFNLVRNKPIKKASKNRVFVKKEIYDEVFKRDKGKCRLKDITCDGGLELHHIVYRSEDKSLINEPSNCICLCTFHHKLVHSNKKKYQPILLKILENKQ